MGIDTPQRLIPADLLATIEAQTGARVTSIVPRAGGGASRLGAELRLRDGDSRETDCYLSYDTRMGDARRLPCFTREAAILRALSGPLADRGVTAPRFLASDPNHLSLLTVLTAGSDRYEAGDGSDPVGLDFMRQLATLHRIDPSSAELESFGDAALPVSDRIRANIADWRRENLATAPEPILLLALDWLEANIPADRGPAVIVHGDAGPGNFLHLAGKVTALLDWELCHYGDPMEDLAQIWVRSLFQKFLPPKNMFAAYEAAGGIAVDIPRVLYHRLYFQAGFTVSGHAAIHGNGDVRPANIGVTMLFYTAHLRVIVQSLAELTSVVLDNVALPQTPPGWRDRTFAIALDDLRDVIAPRATDQQAATKAKALARLIKFWRARDLNGSAYDAAEIAEIGTALSCAPNTVEEGRKALADAILLRRISANTALQLCHARMARDTALMGDAMGRFRDTYFPPL